MDGKHGSAKGAMLIPCKRHGCAEACGMYTDDCVSHPVLRLPEQPRRSEAFLC